MKYIRNPIIVISIVLLLSVLCMNTSSEYPGQVLLSVMIISVIEAFLSKKWLKSISYILFYCFIIGVMYMIAFGRAISPIGTPEKYGTTEFYNKYLNVHLIEDHDMNLDILCRQERNIGNGYVGANTASCVFKLNPDQYNTLSSIIKKSERYKKNESKSIRSPYRLF